MKTLRLVIWSVGEHAQRNILPALLEVEEISLSGVFTRNVEVLTNVSEQYLCKGYVEESEFLKDESIDAVYISSPNAMHFVQIMACLKNNKHVIVEKTAFSSTKEAEEALQLAKEKNLCIMEAFMYRFHNQFIELKKLLDLKKYGKMLFFESNFGFPHLQKNNIRYKKELGGGALSDAGAYTISSVLDVFDNDVELLASQIHYEEGFSVDIRGSAFLKSEKTNIICNWSFGGSYKNQIDIWCEKGHIIVERAFSKPSTFPSQIKVFNNGQLVETIDSSCDNHFIKMFRNFAKEIITDSCDSNFATIKAQRCILDIIKNEC